MKIKNWKNKSGGAGGGTVYFFGLVGALIYFLQHAGSAGETILGIIKAFVWPGVLVYKALELLGM